MKRNKEKKIREENKVIAADDYRGDLHIAISIGTAAWRKNAIKAVRWWKLSQDYGFLHNGVFFINSIRDNLSERQPLLRSQYPFAKIGGSE